MRRLLLLGALCCGMLPAVAQKATPQWNGHLTPDQESSSGGSAARYQAGTVDPTPLVGGCPSNDVLGSASNAFTHILTEANPVAVDNDLNTIVYVHRNNAGVFGGHSGQLRYDLSTNGGATWTSNQGVLNPASVNGTNGARYPSVAIYNPAGNTVAANAYLGYYAPTVATTFNGTVSGVRRLNGTGNTENYNQPTATQTLIPRSVVKGAPGVFWAIDNVYNGTAVTGYRVLKGVWNGSTDITWSVNTTLNPTFNTAFDGAVKVSDYAIAFDPSGMKGWVCMLTHVTPGPTAYAYYPVFYKTTDGGTSWTGPITVDLAQYPCISSNIVSPNVASTAFDVDLTVDVYGNPHALTAVCNGNSAYAVFFSSWHAMVDVTMTDGVWNPVVLRNVYRGRGTWGTAPNTVTMDMEPQISRTADGTKIFYTWGDADSAVVQATADLSPNLYAKAYDVVQRKWTATNNFTSCNVTWNGKIFFPKMAENVLSNTGNYRLPVVFAEFGTGNDPIQPANFHYLDSIAFMPSDFLINQCAASVSISTLDTIVACGSTTLDAGAGAQAYAWSTGATTQAISVSTSGWYKVGVSNGCCTGSDSVYVRMISAPNVTFGASMAGFTGTFTDNTNAQLATYLWNFGDGQFSSLQNPTHTYTNPGTYTVCLTVTNQCGSDSSCTTVNASCPAANAAWSHTSSVLTATFSDLTSGNPTAWAWDFGDGNQSTLQNPVHTYLAAGTYNVCLTITDSCGSDSTCMPVNVCALPVALIDTPAFGDLWIFSPYTFTNLSTAGNGATYAWDFGDGGVSSQQNPTYTYSSPGLYTVCLTVTDSCGTDSSCITVDVLFESVEPGLGGQWSVAPNPVHDQLVLRAVDAPAGDLRLYFRNVLGQTLLRRDHHHAGGNLLERLDVTTLPTGVYFLEVRGEEGRFVAKVIKD